MRLEARFIVILISIIFGFLSTLLIYNYGNGITGLLASVDEGLCPDQNVECVEVLSKETRGVRLGYTHGPLTPDGAIFVSTKKDANNTVHVYRSVDHGATWRIVWQEQRAVGSGLDHVTRSPNSDTVYFNGQWDDAKYAVLWQSTSSGQTWFKSRESKGAGEQRIRMSTSNPLVAYVRDDNKGLFKTTDGGKSWNPINRPEGGEQGPPFIHPLNPDIIYTRRMCKQYPDNPGSYFSTTSGMTWERMKPPLDKLSINYILPSTITPRLIYAAVRTCNQFFPGTDGIYLSTDNGLTWKQVDNTITEVRALAEAPDGTVYAFSHFQGVYRSTDGYFWERIALKGKAVSDGIIDPTNPNILYAVMNGGETYRITLTKEPPTCTYSPRSITFSPPSPVVVGTKVTAGSYFGTACNGKSLQLREGSCIGIQYGSSCTIAGGSCTVSFTPTVAKIYNLRFCEGNTDTQHTGTLTVTDTPPFDFYMSLDPESGIVNQGDSIISTVSLTLMSGTAQSVSFSCSGLPYGASCSFNPTSCKPDTTCSSTLTISTSPTTPTDTYTISVSGTGGGKTHSTTYSLTVQSPVTPSLSLSANPPSVPADGTPSTITAKTSPLAGGVTISFIKTGPGTLSASSCTTDATEGSCSITISSIITGIATITGTATGYTSGSTTVEFVSPVAGEYVAKRLNATGALVETIAIHPTNPNIVYLAGSGGVYKSTDKGKTWDKVLSVSTYGVAVSHQSPDVVYASGLSGFYRSTNGGGSWDKLSNIEMRRLAINPKNDQILFATGKGNVYNTTNGGKDWTVSFTPATGTIWQISINPVNPNNVYVGTENALWNTTDGGKSWKKILDKTYGPVRGVAVAPSNPSIIYAGKAKSTDGGVTWVKKDTGLPASPQEIAVHPSNSLIVYMAAGKYGAFSLNGGDSYTTLDSKGLPIGEKRSVAIDAQNNIVYIGDFTIHKGSPADGDVKFMESSEGLFGVTGIYVAANSKYIFLSTAGHGVYRSADGGKTWERKNNNLYNPGALDHDEIALHPTNPEIAYLGSESNLFKSTDGGNSWYRVFGVNQQARPTVDFQEPNIVYVVSAGGLYKSSNGGEPNPWEDLTSKLPSPATNKKLDMDPKNSKRIFIATTTGTWESTDGGNSWPRRIFDQPGKIRVGSTGSLYWFADLKGVYNSSDDGKTWSKLTTPFSRPEELNETDGTIWVGTSDKGVYKSTDRGVTWIPENNGFGVDKLSVKHMALDPKNPKAFFVVVSGDGIYYLSPTLPTECARDYPQVSISPLSKSGSAGQPLTYDIYVTNNDKNCGIEAFSLTSSCPTGWPAENCKLATNSLSIPSERKVITTITVTSPTTALPNTYKFSVKATNDAAQTYSKSASADYVVFLPCILASATITNCEGGSCEKGETVDMSAPFTGPCTTDANIYFQIDAKSEDSSCTIQYKGGSLEGITQVGPTISEIARVYALTPDKRYTGTWNVPPIPTTCEGKTVYAYKATIWEGGPEVGRLVTKIEDKAIKDSEPVGGFLTFGPVPVGCVDKDRDKYYGILEACPPPFGADCNDDNANINPSAEEICGNNIDENCDGKDAVCPPPPGGDGRPPPPLPPVITKKTIKPLTKEPSNVTPENVTAEQGEVSLELIAPDTVESGELFDVTVKLLSPTKRKYKLNISNVLKEIELESNKEKIITIAIQAPEARGPFSVIASIDGTIKSKITNLDFKPLFLYVNESKVGNATRIDITIRIYDQPSQTEFRIIKDGRSDVYIDLIEGKKEYSSSLLLRDPGEYKMTATTSNATHTIDTDSYELRVEGEKKFNFSLVIIIAIAVIFIITIIILVFRWHMFS